MVNGDSASPIFIIDEADKARDDGQINGLDFLHKIFEPESAAHLNDEYLEVPLMTTNVIWLFLANDISAFSDSILDRVIVVDIPAASEQQQHAIMQSIAREVAIRLNLPPTLTIPDNVMTRLVESPPRKARQILERSFANAARRGTLSINRDDLARACAMVSARETINKKSFGFRPTRDHDR